MSTMIPSEHGIITGGLAVGMDLRRDKVNYYLDVAETISQNSTCLRFHWGAVIVSDDEVIATGYMGAPRGRQNCTDVGCCYKDRGNLIGDCVQGMCRSVHAEVNAIISASRRMMKGATMYLVGLDMTSKDYIEKAECCSSCKMIIINSGIRDVYIRSDKDIYKRYTVLDWVKDDDTLTDRVSF